MLNAIGNELRITRIRKNMKINDVAKELGIDKETLRRYEKSASGLTVEKLEKIFNYYGIDRFIFFKNVCDYMHD